jgi:hypothetical protein
MPKSSASTTDRSPSNGYDLSKSMVSLSRDVLRDEAASVLQQCTEEGGEIYNGRRSG